MRHLILLLVLASISLGHVRAQSQSEMNQEAAADFQKVDAELNAVYKKVLASNANDAQFCADLKDAQRAWLKFVEFHLKTLFPLKEGEDPRVVYGSIYPLDLATAKSELYSQRVAQLKELLSGR